MRSALLTGLVVLTGACATGGSGGGDAGMAYGVPSASPLVYERGDSLFASINVPGMGGIDLAFEQSMTLSVSFAPSASGAAVSAEVQEYSATLSNPEIGLVFSNEHGASTGYVSVVVPIAKEFGDDDFATLTGFFADIEHPERFVPELWSINAGLTPSVPMGPGTMLDIVAVASAYTSSTRTAFPSSLVVQALYRVPESLAAISAQRFAKAMNPSSFPELIAASQVTWILSDTAFSFSSSAPRFPISCLG